jgi:vancomycin permeability regulator SanA
MPPPAFAAMPRFLVRYRKALLTLAALSALAVAFAGFANYRILTRHTARLYTDLTQMPSRDIALVLGANPVTASGAGNLHFAATTTGPTMTSPLR